MLQRAYSLVQIKGFDPLTRTFTGTATSPVPDRVGDEIKSEGVTYTNPSPLMLYHDSRMPVGEATFGRPGKNGTPFSAVISTIDRPSGVVRDRLDEAVDSLAAKPPLIRGVSIGFRPLEDPTYNKDTGGFVFPKIEVLELSMVTIPAHQDATIDTVKALFHARSASGASSPKPSAGVSAFTRAVKAAPRDAMKNKISDQIKSFEATLVAKTTERDAIMDKAGETGETLDAEQSESYDTLTAEIKSLNSHLVRLREREEEQIGQAQVIAEAKTSRGGVSGGIQMSTPVVQSGKDLGNDIPGIALARVAIAKASSWLSMMEGRGVVSPEQRAKEFFPGDPRIVNYLKTGVVGQAIAGTNTGASLAPANTIGTDFITYLRSKTIIDSFGQNGIPALRKLPFNVKVPRQTTGGTGYWVGEGKPKPVTNFQFDTITMDYTKAAAMAVITRELIRYSVINADQIVRDQLVAATVARIDTDIVDPAKAISSHVNPASLTNGVTSKATAGTSAANVLTDVEKLVAPFLNNNYDVTSLVLIMPNTLCLALSLMLTTNGVRQFPNISVQGGSLSGIPVIASGYAGSLASYGNMVICVSANDIGLADDGVVDVSVSTEASLQMDDAATDDSVTPTATTMVSMFQTNSVAILTERFINWAKLRSTAVTWMQDVNWGAVGSPRNT